MCLIKVNNYLINELNQDLPLMLDAALVNLSLLSQIKEYKQKVQKGL